MGELRDIELAKPGRWFLGTGEVDITPQMLRDAADFATSGHPAAAHAPVHLGHHDRRFDGEPAMGWLENVRVVGEGDDVTLVGDVTDMPDWLAEVAPAAWPQRSIEGYQKVRVGDREYGMVIDGLALLGVAPPGIESIRSLRDVQTALGIEGAERIAATLQPRSKDEGEPEEVQEGVHMDRTKLLESLGLQESASDDDIVAALATAGVVQVVPETNPEPEADPTPGSVRVSDQPGVIAVDAEVFEEMRLAASRGQEAYERLRVAERDEIIGAAIRAGKFAPARREHWSKLWDNDPDGTRDTLAKLVPGAVPVEASGYASFQDQSEDEALYAAMYGKES
jgi:hypothetical protein